MNSCIRRTLVTSGLTVTSVGLVTALSAGPAGAVQPAHPACFGVDISSYARGEGPHGALVSTLARNPGMRLGELTALHRSGALPDDMVENSCND